MGKVSLVNIVAKMLGSSPFHNYRKTMRFRKPELIPLLFIIVAVTVLGGLGIWQVERLQWKNAQLAAIEQAQALPALGTLPDDIGGLDYHNVVLTGTFSNDKTLHMVGSVRGEGSGFLIITPFTLEDDGRVILVNRGFSPPGQEAKPKGLQNVKGIIRPLRTKRLFSPDNHPEKNVWFYEDIPAMSHATGLTLTPLMVEAVGTHEKGIYPIPSDGKINIRNDHRNYAITWFALALIGLVMFGFYHRVPANKDNA